MWHKAHQLTLEVYKGTRCFPPEERYGLTGQIRRSCASIAANLAEGCGRRSDGEMARFIQIALGSGAELSNHILLARDLGFMNGGEYNRLSASLDEIMRMLSALSTKLRKPMSERGLAARS